MFHLSPIAHIPFRLIIVQRVQIHESNELKRKINKSQKRIRRCNQTEIIVPNPRRINKIVLLHLSLFPFLPFYFIPVSISYIYIYTHTYGSTSSIFDLGIRNTVTVQPVQSYL